MRTIYSKFTRAVSVCLVFALVLAVVGIAPIQVSAAAFPFTDVPESHQYREAIEYVYNAGLMNGISDTEFAPDTHLNRAMVITILHRISGSTGSYTPSFPDVPSDTWYYDAVGWGEHYGIATGYDDGKFYPGLVIRVEQAATFLYRYGTEYENYTYNLISSSYVSGMSDYNQINTYARVPVNWALNCGVLPFNTSTCTPQASVTRGLFCQYLYDYLTHVLGDGMAFVSREFISYRYYTDTNTPQIANQMERLGCDAAWGYDVHPRELNFAMRNSRVLLTLLHGMNDSLVLRNHFTLEKSDITQGCLSDAELIVVCACNAGNDLVPHMYNVGGAGAVIGFTGNIGFLKPHDGINYFNKLMFQHLADGDDLATAIRIARALSNAAYPDIVSGADSIVLYGNYY